MIHSIRLLLLLTLLSTILFVTARRSTIADEIAPLPPPSAFLPLHEVGKAWGEDEYAPAVAFGDIDGDSDLDLLIGNENGAIYCFRNTAGAGNPMNLQIEIIPMWETVDPPGSTSTPCIYDMNNDGLLTTADTTMMLRLAAPGTTPTADELARGVIELTTPSRRIVFRELAARPVASSPRDCLAISAIPACATTGAWHITRTARDRTDSSSDS